MYLICKQQLCINNDICWFVPSNRVYMYIIIIWADHNDYECEHELKTSTGCSYSQNLTVIPATLLTLYPLHRSTKQLLYHTLHGHICMKHVY